MPGLAWPGLQTLSTLSSAPPCQRWVPGGEAAEQATPAFTITKKATETRLLSASSPGAQCSECAQRSEGASSVGAARSQGASALWEGGVLCPLWQKWLLKHLGASD